MGYLAVDDSDLPMIPVVEYSCKEWNHLIERHTFDAIGLKLLPVILWNVEHRTDVIINEPDIKSLRSLALQYLKYGIPHIPLVHDEVFHEYILLRTLQVSDEIIHHIIAYGIILYTGVLIQKRLSHILHIITYPVCRLRL